MYRCLQLAQNGLGTTYPNPLVGSVIVHKGKIIGEGWHRKSGESHAEVHAIESVKDVELLKESTLYVNLEPCSHFGKTPPCTDMIIKYQIPEVVIGTIDPFGKVCGAGVLKLEKAGIRVTVGIMEEECRKVNKRFFCFHQHKRPYIILKWAQSYNQMFAPLNKDEARPYWISNIYSRQLVHQWRTQEQGIMVGTNTVIVDNPQLDARLWKGISPTRIVIDKDLKLPKDKAIFNEKIPTIVINQKKESTEKQNICFKKIDFDKSVPLQISERMYEMEIQSIIIEGGAKLIQSFIDADLWDEARVFTSESFIQDGLKAPTIELEPSKHIFIEKDRLTFYENPNRK